jgi:hypothetical protein
MEKPPLSLSTSIGKLDRSGNYRWFRIACLVIREVQSERFFFDGLYEGSECNAQGVEIFASLPGEWRGLLGDELVELDYKGWPRSRQNCLDTN